MTQNYESLRIKASRLCPKSGFQDVTGQIKIPCLFPNGSCQILSFAV